MGLFAKLKGELVDIVEWIDDPGKTLCWRFPRYHNQIKNGAMLIVRPGQVAVFVHEGKIADQFGPGTYELNTSNLPIMSTLQGWKFGFDSPFKAEVYFVSTRRIPDLRWGTPNPIMMRDAEFGAIRLRAFGNYVLRAVDPKRLIEELVGTDGVFETDEVTDLLRALIVSSFAEVLGASNIAALDLAANYQILAEELRRTIQDKIDDEYGLEIPSIQIVNVSFPEAVEKALDERTSMGVIGDLNRYQQYQFGKATLAAAENQASGGAADGMGLGVGLAMANRFMGPGATGPAAPPAGPPPLQQTQWYVAENGQTLGPFPPTQLQQWIADGRVTPDTLVWSAGMAAWQKASETTALLGAFNESPPPPPPAPSA